MFEKPKIWIAEGVTGSGKTYDAVRQIVDERLPKGQTVVVVGIDLNVKRVCEYVERFHFYTVQPGQLTVYTQEQAANLHSVVVRGTFGLPSWIYVDEIQNMFNARDWNRTSRDVLKLITHHRHYHISMWFMTQNVYNVDKQFVRQMHGLTTYRDMQGHRFGPAPKWPFPETWAWDYDRDMRTPLGKPRKILREKTIYDLYDSFQDVEGVAVSPAVQDAQAKAKGLQRARRQVYWLRVACGWLALSFMALTAAGCKLGDWKRKAAAWDSYTNDLGRLEKRLAALEARKPVVAATAPIGVPSPAAAVPESVTGSLGNIGGVASLYTAAGKIGVGDRLVGGVVQRIDLTDSKIWIAKGGVVYPVRVE